jgi:hypothetical protein
LSSGIHYILDYVFYDLHSKIIRLLQLKTLQFVIYNKTGQFNRKIFCKCQWKAGYFWFLSGIYFNIFLKFRYNLHLVCVLLIRRLACLDELDDIIFVC